jgi:hypothetical protein
MAHTESALRLDWDLSPAQSLAGAPAPDAQMANSAWMQVRQVLGNGRS